MPNELIPLDVNNALNGTAITHTPGSNVIGLAPNQTYSIEYSFVGDPPQGGNVAAAGLLLNGALIPGTRTGVTIDPTAPTSFSLAGGTIINTTTQSTLSLVNLSNGTVGLSSAGVNVIKLA
jgi:hypothetical protein